MNLDECHFLVTFFHTGFLITPSSLLLTLPLLEERCIPGCRRSTHFHRQSQFTITQLGGGADPPSERPIGSAVSAEQGRGLCVTPLLYLDIVSTMGNRFANDRAAISGQTISWRRSGGVRAVSNLGAAGQLAGRRLHRSRRHA